VPCRIRCRHALWIFRKRRDAVWHQTNFFSLQCCLNSDDFLKILLEQHDEMGLAESTAKVAYNLFVGTKTCFSMGLFSASFNVANVHISTKRKLNILIQTTVSLTFLRWHFLEYSSLWKAVFVNLLQSCCLQQMLTNKAMVFINILLSAVSRLFPTFQPKHLRLPKNILRMPTHKSSILNPIWFYLNLCLSQSSLFFPLLTKLLLLLEENKALVDLKACR